METQNPAFQASLLYGVRFPLGSGINGNYVTKNIVFPDSVLYASLWEAELMETSPFF